jgi:hypothetical protein
MVGVWADPVTAQVMMTLRAGMSASWVPRPVSAGRGSFHDANGHRII